MNAHKPEAGEAAHPMTGVPQKRLARNCRRKICVILRVLG